MEAIARNREDHLYGYVISVWRNDPADLADAPWWVPMFLTDGVLYDQIAGGRPVPLGNWVCRIAPEWDIWYMSDEQFGDRFRIVD